MKEYSLIKSRRNKIMIKIALLGSTGSIGRQVLNVVDRHSDKFKIVSLAAGKNAEALEAQINKYKPEIACLTDSEAALNIKELPRGTSFYYGENALLHAVFESADIVFVAVMGFCGLAAVKLAVDMKKTVALANKETLVAGGKLITELAKKNGVNIIPVDSEHSAIFQALDFDKTRKFKNLILTASGGAFRDFTKEQMKTVKAVDALKHPNWNMGKKITVDCATMLNKGLEVIEAAWLYDAPLSKIKVLVHPESVVHSMVEFDDGCVMAQMSYPSMELPIQLALTYPERFYTGIPQLELAGKTLHFNELDHERFPCFDIAVNAFKSGDNFACAMNAANEEAVKLFLEDKIAFPEIADYIEYAVSKTERAEVTMENLENTDKTARIAVGEKFLRR